MQPMAKPQGFDRARVAYSVDYDIPANWKIVWENNRECYHCDVNHPQYVKANFDRYDADKVSPAIAQQIETATRRNAARWAATGLVITHPHVGLAQFPDADRNLWYSANRTALANGYITESIDGWQVAPLMGDYTDPDVGTLRLRTLPNFWCHASCDHAVLMRLTPVGPRLTKARVIWLVHQDAQPEIDYNLEALLRFWQLTSEQDWVICETVQRGVDSSAYTPGPLSPSKEYNVDHFTRWYVRQLDKAEPQSTRQRTPAHLGEF
jgi:Rieske 2Fe-2S family protein